MPRSLASSYAQPDCLIDKARSGQRLPARVVRRDLWKVQPRALEEALKYMPPERLVVAPGCGMKYLSRDAAFAKLSNIAAGRNLIAG